MISTLVQLTQAWFTAMETMLGQNVWLRVEMIGGTLEPLTGVGAVLCVWTPGGCSFGKCVTLHRPTSPVSFPSIFSPPLHVVLPRTCSSFLPLHPWHASVFERLSCVSRLTTCAVAGRLEQRRAQGGSLTFISISLWDHVTAAHPKRCVLMLIKHRSDNVALCVEACAVTHTHTPCTKRRQFLEC